MAAVLVIGALLVATGVVLLLNLAGAADFVIRHVTSRYLGTLPPGYANSRGGFRVYAALVVTIGLVFVGAATAASQVGLGLLLLCAGIAGFGTVSALAIRGEVETYRRLKR